MQERILWLVSDGKVECVKSCSWLCQCDRWGVHLIAQVPLFFFLCVFSLVDSIPSTIETSFCCSCSDELLHKSTGFFNQNIPQEAFFRYVLPARVHSPRFRAGMFDYRCCNTCASHHRWTSTYVQCLSLILHL